MNPDDIYFNDMVAFQFISSCEVRNETKAIYWYNEMVRLNIVKHNVPLFNALENGLIKLAVKTYDSGVDKITHGDAMNLLFKCSMRGYLDAAKMTYKIFIDNNYSLSDWHRFDWGARNVFMMACENDNFDVALWLMDTDEYCKQNEHIFIECYHQKLLMRRVLRQLRNRAGRANVVTLIASQ